MRLARPTCDNGGERLCVQTCPANQGAIQLFLGHQSLNIVRLDAAAIENAQGGSKACGKLFGSELANELMGLSGHFGSCYAASADGPDRFISYQNTGEFLGGQRADAAVKLPVADVSGAIGLAIGQGFAHANDGREAGGEGGFGLFKNGFFGFTEVLPALGMTDDGVAATGFNQHGSGDFAGESAFLFPENILGRNGDAGP